MAYRGKTGTVGHVFMENRYSWQKTGTSNRDSCKTTLGQLSLFSSSNCPCFSAQPEKRDRPTVPVWPRGGKQGQFASATVPVFFRPGPAPMLLSDVAPVTANATAARPRQPFFAAGNLLFFNKVAKAFGVGASHLLTSNIQNKYTSMHQQPTWPRKG